MSIRHWLLAVAALLFLLIGAVYPLRWYSTEQYVEDRIPSPDNRWIAIVTFEQFGPSFGPIFYAVSLRESSGWFSSLLETKVLEIGANAKMGPPKVQWNGSVNLRIKVRDQTADAEVPVRREEFKGIKIDYD